MGSDYMPFHLICNQTENNNFAFIISNKKLIRINALLVVYFQRKQEKKKVK